MLTLEQISLHRGGRPVLTDCSLRINSGDRIGLVGANGAGKSSLMQLILGQLAPDGGQIALQSGVRLAHLEQEHAAEQRCALEVVIDGDSQIGRLRQALAAAEQTGDHEALATLHQQFAEVDGYRAESRAGEILHGLGVTPAQQRQSVRALSGGLRVRVQLARALMTPSDLLLLDEPTNHLDLDAILWLESWLARYPGSLLVISHDRDFFDHVVNQILHLDSGVLTRYAGHYSDFERSRAEARRQQASAYQRQQQQLQQTQRFIDRFKAKASKARQAQSRVKRLAKLAGTEAVRAERALHITLPVPLKLPNSLLSLHDVDCGYGADARILANANFGLEAGDRIGLLGPNGAGKSTLVKTLVGELPPMSGERKAHPDLRIGYFAQHTVESLVAGTTPLDHLRKLAPDVANQELRDFLGRWNFPGDRAFEVIDTFSGGEKARLALALIAYRRPNVLLLDEPTNHLDLDMREALAEALSDFDGAIVMVSHDRHLIGLVCDEYWRVAAGKVEPFDGDLDEYAAWLRSRPGSDNPKTPAPKKAPEPAKPTPAPVASKPKVNPHKLQKAEERVARLEGKLAECEARMADPAVYADAGKVADLGRTQLQLRTELEQAEAELLALYD